VARLAAAQLAALDPGAGPLIRLCDLQAAEYLRNQLARAPGGVVRPTYAAYPLLAALRPDLLAYRRFQSAGRASPAFVPRDGRRFVRVAVGDLPVRVLAATLERARPRGRLSGALGPEVRAGEVLAPALRSSAHLSPAQAEWVAALTAVGLGVEAATTLAGWRITAVEAEDPERTLDLAESVRRLADLCAGSLVLFRRLRYEFGELAADTLSAMAADCAIDAAAGLPPTAAAHRAVAEALVVLTRELTQRPTLLPDDDLRQWEQLAET
jgi:hypothetical protein